RDRSDRPPARCGVLVGTWRRDPPGAGVAAAGRRAARADAGETGLGHLAPAAVADARSALLGDGKPRPGGQDRRAAGRRRGDEDGEHPTPRARWPHRAHPRQPGRQPGGRPGHPRIRIMPPEKTVRLRITGRVQAVGYRLWATRTATSLGLRGWVRNRADGSVEVLAIGPSETVTDFVAACRHGPRAALVMAAWAGRTRGVGDAWLHP